MMYELILVPLLFFAGVYFFLMTRPDIRLSLGLGPLYCRRVATKREMIQLIQTLKKGSVVRAGATTNYVRRVCEYEKEGYYGDFIYTESMELRTDENILLRDCFKGDNFPRHNRHRRSNITEDRSGYVYIIVGSRQNI